MASLCILIIWQAYDVLFHNPTLFARAFQGPLQRGSPRGICGWLRLRRFRADRGQGQRQCLDLEVKNIKKLKKEQPTTCHNWTGLLFRGCGRFTVSSVQKSIKGDMFARN